MKNERNKIFIYINKTEYQNIFKSSYKYNKKSYELPQVPVLGTISEYVYTSYLNCIILNKYCFEELHLFINQENFYI